MFKKSSILLIALLVISTSVSANEKIVDGPSNLTAGAVEEMPITSLHQWVVQRMVSWLPPGRSFIKDALETPEEGKKRYEEIAQALISVVFDPNEKPIFGGQYGRSKTLALLLSVAYFESGYRKDVDLGLGPLARGDNGQSWCMMQVMLGRPSHLDSNTRRRVVLEDKYYKIISRPTKYENGQVQYTSDPPQGWGGLELVRDRKRCFRTGLHLIRKSFDACRTIPLLDRLSVYGAGECIKNMEASRVRVRKAQKWLAHTKPPLTDKEIMGLLHPVPKTVEKDDSVNMGPISVFFNMQGPRRDVTYPLI